MQSDMSLIVVKFPHLRHSFGLWRIDPSCYMHSKRATLSKGMCRRQGQALSVILWPISQEKLAVLDKVVSNVKLR
jgi:hypothetical protein